VKSVLKIAGKATVVLVGMVLFILIMTVAPIDRTPVQESDVYPAMLAAIDSIQPSQVTDDSLLVGFAKANITPNRAVATAGYVKRHGAPFTAVHDSIFVRTLVFQQGATLAALVSLDMLIVPPRIYQRLKESLPSIGYSIHQVFLSATHTHNSIGQWENHFVGEMYAGPYEEMVIEQVTQAIVTSIQQAEATMQHATLSSGAIPLSSGVSNRLVSGGQVDSLLHVAEFRYADGRKMAISSYTAHATCLSSKELSVSRDYPGVLVDELEKQGYAFALFMAGAVGSHAPAPMADGWDRISFMGNLLADTIMRSSEKLIARRTDRLAVGRLPLLLTKQQIKILPDWRVRAWASGSLLGLGEPTLSYLHIGDLILIGAPCDFSGMLTPPIYQASKKSHVLITSFNGGYIGYITPDQLYDYDGYETQTMNWYGMGNGDYLQTSMIRILNRLDP
jgi:neutral ceramidase